MIGPLLGQDKVTQLIAVVQASMPAGITLAGACRGRWLDLRCDYEGKTANVPAALDLRRLMIKAQVNRALDDLTHVAQRVARKMVHDRGAAHAR
jgi:hypothetical protein